MNVAFEDFGNPEVIITAPGDPRLHCVDIPGAHCFFQQDTQGPTYITVRASADDEVLQGFSARFGVPFVDLQRVRDQQLATGTGS